jgi:hypothetical protein
MVSQPAINNVNGFDGSSQVLVSSSNETSKFISCIDIEKDQLTGKVRLGYIRIS